MSFPKKIVTSYSKSLFQNIKTLPKSKQYEEYFDLSTLMVEEQKTFLPNVYIVGEELYILDYTIKNSKPLEAFLKNPTYREQQKLDILTNIFPGLTLTTKSFLKVLADRSHLGLLCDISEEYNHILAKFKNVIQVKLTVANALEENSGELLLETLKTITGVEDIILSISYDPKLLGGIVIEYNSNSIDASLLKEFSLFFTEV